MKRSILIGIAATALAVSAALPTNIASGSVPPGDTTGSTPPGDTAGSTPPGDTAGSTAPGDTTTPPGDTTGSTPPGDTGEVAPPGDAGRGGHFLALQWQAPSIVNSYLSGGTKDILAGSLVLEPLANVGPDGSMVPKLAAEIPTLENGGFAEDLLSITWTLKPGILWSDGTPLTADDVVFTWEYNTHPGVPSVQKSTYEAVSNVTAVDELTVLVEFTAPTPFPYAPFVGAVAPIIQRAQFADVNLDDAASATEQNQFPIGTGPYSVADFRAEDTVVFEMNPNYRGVPDGQPFFSSFEIKGGGDAAGAARTVLEEGGADYAWNLQVPPEVLTELESAGIGRIDVGFGANYEHINLNQANNRNPDARSEYADGANPHPFFGGEQGPVLAEAMSLAINREELTAVGYGDTGRPAANVWNAEPAVSPNNERFLTQDIEGANALLDEAGILDTNEDGIREMGGEEIILDYYTSTNAVRQDFQALIQAYWTEIGIGVALRNANASIFFGPATNDFSYLKFYADLQMYTATPLADPQLTFAGYTAATLPSEANGWSGENIPRYVSEEYEAVYAELATTGDPEERIAAGGPAQRPVDQRWRDHPARSPWFGVGVLEQYLWCRSAQRLGLGVLERRTVVSSGGLSSFPHVT